MPEAFHAWFPVSVKSLKVTFAARNFGLRPKKCRPVADEMTRETHARKKPLVPRVGIWGPLLEARKTSSIFSTPSSSAYLMASREQDLDSGLGNE